MQTLMELFRNSRALQVLADFAAKGATLLLIATAVSLSMRNASAAARHLLWAVTATSLILLPVATLALPQWRVLPVPNAPAPVLATAPNAVPGIAALKWDAPILNAPSSQMSAGMAAPAPEFAPPAERASDSKSAPRFAFTTAQLMLLAWLAGVFAILSTIAFGLLRVRALARAAKPITDESLNRTIALVAETMHIRRVVALEAGDFAMPMTWGIVRPYLLLPRAAITWPHAKLEAVLRHELAHIRRRDAMWQLLGEVACALHWFNPLAWHAALRLRVEREHACDDAVLNAGSRASDYATELLEIARSLKSPRATSMAAIAMAQPNQLEGRLLAVLDEKRTRGDVARRWPAWIAAALVMLPLAALRPRSGEAKADIPTETSLITIGSDASVNAWAARNHPSRRHPAKAAPRVATSTAPARPQGRCAGEDTRNVSINSNSDDDYQRIKWQTSRCKGTLLMRGKIRLAGDMSGIESMAPGAEFKLTEDDGVDTHELVVTNTNGQIAYDFSVNGKQHAWDATARTWFSTELTFLVRRTGFAANERIDYLLAHGGVPAVLQEVDAMSSDYVQRLYLDRMLGKTQVTPAALETVIAQATKSIDSDYEMAEFLMSVARKYEFNDALRRSFLQAANTLNSDYEHRRVLSAVLTKGGLSSADLAAMLNSSTAIGSDYEKAELLASIAARYNLTPSMRAPFLGAARSIHSDYEKGRVLKTLLKQGTLSGAEAADVLQAVGTMQSDYEKAEVLRLVAGSDMSSPALQQAYLAIAAGIKSDYELRRSLMALVQKQKLTPAGLDIALNAAGNLESDYERAELMTYILQNYQLTPDQRSRMVKAVGTIRSDYERGRVSSLLIKQLSN